MRLPAPDTHCVWYKPSVLPVEALIIGAAHWYSHWDASIGRTRRCGGIACALCAAGRSVEQRYVLMCRILGDEQLVELRSRHWLILSEIQDIYGSVIGATIRLWRDSSASNAPVSVSFVSFTSDVIERSITNLVARFGAEPLFTRNARTSTFRVDHEQEHYEHSALNGVAKKTRQHA